MRQHLKTSYSRYEEQADISLSQTHQQLLMVFEFTRWGRADCQGRWTGLIIQEAMLLPELSLMFLLHLMMNQTLIQQLVLTASNKFKDSHPSQMWSVSTEQQRISRDTVTSLKCLELLWYLILFEDIWRHFLSVVSWKPIILRGCLVAVWQAPTLMPVSLV